MLPDGQISKSGQALARKIFRFSEVQIGASNPPSHPAKGRLAIVTDRAVGCEGRCGVRRALARRAKTHHGVRRSRVVLAPRPWRPSVPPVRVRQRWQETPLTGESTKYTVRPSRGESRDVRLNLWWLTRVLVFIGCEAAGAVGARLSLRPFLRRGPMKMQNPGETRRGNEDVCFAFRQSASADSVHLAPLAGRSRIASQMRSG